MHEHAAVQLWLLSETLSFNKSILICINFIGLDAKVDDIF